MRGADPESVELQAQDSHSERGVPIYAVESLFLGVLEIAWTVVPLRMGTHLLADQLLLLPLAVASVLNVVACSLVPRNATALGAFASLCLTLTLTYLWLWAEVGFSESVASLYFSGVILPQIPGAISLAFMTIHSFLALASIHRRLWRQTLWLEGTLCLLSAMLTMLCFRNQAKAPFGVLLFFVVAFIVAVAYAETRDVWSKEFYILYLAVSLCLAVTGIVTGPATSLASIAYPVLAIAVAALLSLRIVNRYHAMSSALEPSAQEERPAVTGELGHVSPASATRYQPAPFHALHQRALVSTSLVHPVALCAPNPRAEAVLFGNSTRILRQHSKKAI